MDRGGKINPLGQFPHVIFPLDLLGLYTIKSNILWLQIIRPSVLLQICISALHLSSKHNLFQSFPPRRGPHWSLAREAHAQSHSGDVFCMKSNRNHKDVHLREKHETKTKETKITNNLPDTQLLYLLHTWPWSLPQGSCLLCCTSKCFYFFKFMLVSKIELTSLFPRIPLILVVFQCNCDCHTHHRNLKIQWKFCNIFFFPKRMTWTCYISLKHWHLSNYWEEENRFYVNFTITNGWSFLNLHHF